MDFNQAIRTLERASSIPQAATLSARLAPRSMAAYGAGWKRVRKTITENSQLSSYTSNPDKEREILTSALAHIAAVSTSTTGYEHANTAIKHFLNARSPDFSSIRSAIAKGVRHNVPPLSVRSTISTSTNCSTKLSLCTTRPARKISRLTWPSFSSWAQPED